MAATVIMNATLAKGNSDHDQDRNLQKSVFPWLSFQNGGVKLHSTTSAREVALDSGVPQAYFQTYLNRQIREEAALKSLPFTLLMVVTYTLMVIMHNLVEPINAVEDSLAGDIDNANFAFTSPYIGHKGLEDVNSHADFWSWAIQGFAPLMFIQGTSWAEGHEEDPLLVAASYDYPRWERGYWLHYNRIVGGIRFRQERSEDVVCDSVPELLRFYAKTCVGGDKYKIYPELPDAAYMAEPQGAFWLWIQEDLDDVLDLLQAKEAEEFWLDNRTMKIEIAIPAYNSEMAVYCYLTINLYFSRGGHIWKRVIPMSTSAQWFNGITNIISDFAWFSCLVYLTLSELRVIQKTLTASGWRGIRKEYLEFWIIVDWVSVIFGYLIAAIFFLRVRGSSQLNSELQALAGINEVLNQEEYRAQATTFTDLLENEVMAMYNFRTLIGTYPLLIMIRLFKAFAAQPRLSIVTKTLSSSAVDLVHFLLVFLSIFFSYAVAGIVLFGREVDGFTTPGRAVVTCFRTMMGDFDWDELSQVGRWEAGVWFITFMIIIVLLMLNMLLAIVMDAYSEQKELLREAKPLWHETAELFSRMRQERKGKLVSLKNVARYLAEYEEQEQTLATKKDMTPGISSTTLQMSSVIHDRSEYHPLITVPILMDVCEFMGEEQAADLLTGAAEAWYYENKKEASIDEMLQVMYKVNWSTKQLKQQVKNAIAVAKDANSAVDLTNDLDPEDEDEDEPVDNAKQLATNFLHVMTSCRMDLKTASEWIGVAEVGQAAMPTGGGGAGGTGSTGSSSVGNTPAHTLGPPRQDLRPVRDLSDIVAWRVYAVRHDREAVFKECRACGIGATNDEKRLSALGCWARALQVDSTDGTVKCRIPEVGDVWFPARALAHTDVEAPEHRSQSLAGEDVRGNGGTGSSGNSFEPGPGVSNISGMAYEEFAKRAQELEADLCSGRTTVSEALAAVSELEWRLLREHEEKNKVSTKFQLLKKKVVGLTRENRRLLEEARKQEERIGTVGSSKEEYFELLRNMVEENTKLKAKLQELASKQTLDFPDALADSPPKLAIMDGRPSRESSRDRDRGRSRSRGPVYPRSGSSGHGDRSGGPGLGTPSVAGTGSPQIANSASEMSLGSGSGARSGGKRPPAQHLTAKQVEAELKEMRRELRKFQQRTDSQSQQQQHASPRPR